MTVHRLHRKKAIHMKFRHSWRLRRIFDGMQQLINTVQQQSKVK